METLKVRCQELFPKSRKLKDVRPSEGQLNNVVARLQQIFTNEELTMMDDKSLVRQIERVWPVARYVDRD